MVEKFGALRGAFFSIIILAVSVCGQSAQEKSQQQAPLKYEVSVILKPIHIYVTD